MTDREKFLKLHGDLQKIELPSDLEEDELQKIVNTVEEGLSIMKNWIVDKAKEKWGKKDA